MRFLTRLSVILCVCLGLAVSAKPGPDIWHRFTSNPPQTHTFCPLDGTCVWTGPNSFASLSVSLPMNLTQGGFTHTLTVLATGARTWTLQDTSDTFVFRNTSDTLTNKTLNSPVLSSPFSTGTDSGTETLVNKTLTAPVISNPSTTGTDSGAQTLTNKTFDISANTLKNSTNTAGHVPRNNGTQYVDGTLAAADLSNGVTGSGAVVLANAPTITSLTLSSPTITTPTINGASTGTGVQGTDTKLLTAGTIGANPNVPCADANGGVSTSGCLGSYFYGISTTSQGTCPTGTANGATCAMTVSLGRTEPDTAYKVTCTGSGTITGYPFILGTSKSTTQVVVTISNGAAAQAVASGVAEMDCTVIR